MLPENSFNNTVNSVTAHSVLLSYSGAPTTSNTFSIHAANFKHLFIGKFSSWVFFAFGLTAFVLTVFHVVIPCSQEQVRGVDAQSVITTVQNTKSIRMAYVDEPRIPVNEHIILVIFVASKPAISVIINLASPNPALTTDRMNRPVLINLFPESNIGRWTTIDASRHGTTPLVALNEETWQAGEVPAFRPASLATNELYRLAKDGAT